MTDHGAYEQDAEKLECYNCGMKGHMFFACPEDTRRVPAGLEASRKRQASGNDYHGSVKRTKGPVVTHYPPPLPPPPPGVPPIPPPPATYCPRPSYEGHYLGPPPGLPIGPPLPRPPLPGHYEPYPAPDRGRETSRGFPYPSARDTYEHHSRSAPPGAPLEAAYRPPRYGEYHQYHSGLSPGPSHGRPYSAASDRYDDRPPGLPPGPPYGAPPRPGFQSHYDQYPPASDIDGYPPRPPPPCPPPPYSDSYRNPLQYGYDGPSAPPARPYPPNQGLPPPGSYPLQSHQYPPFDLPPYSARHDDRSAEWTPYDQRRDTHDQVDHRSESRHDRERYHRRSRYDSPKSRGRSERRFQDRPPKAFSSQNSTPPAQSTKDSIASQNEKSEHRVSNGTASNAGATDENRVDDPSWEEEMIFNELPAKITKDLIREPLPLNWTDEPIMPPQYGKETIISRYVTAESIEEFATDVRKTKAWEVVQHHPAFVKPADMTMAKLREYESALSGGSMYKKQNRQNINNRQRDKNFNQRLRGHRQNRQSYQHVQSHESRDDQFYYERPREAEKNRLHNPRELVRGSEIENGPSRKRSKTSSPEPGEVCESDDDQKPLSPRPKSASPLWEEEHRQARPNRNGRAANSSRDSGVGLPDASPRVGARRRPSLPGPPTSASPLSRSPSRRSSTGSPLTPTELELLGMGPDSSDSEARQDSPPPPLPPPPPPNETSTKPRQRPARAKLHAAYQRRW